MCVIPVLRKGIQTGWPWAYDQWYSRALTCSKMQSVCKRLKDNSGVILQALSTLHFRWGLHWPGTCLNEQGDLTWEPQVPTAPLPVQYWDNRLSHCAWLLFIYLLIGSADQAEVLILRHWDFKNWAIAPVFSSESVSSPSWLQTSYVAGVDFELLPYLPPLPYLCDRAEITGVH